MKLDLIDNIIINNQFGPLTNFHSIPQLLEGIFMTYNMMIGLEKNYWELSYPGKPKEVLDIFNQSTFSMNGEVNQVSSQAINLFHWYSINIINFAKCCGLVKHLNTYGIMPERLAGDKALRSNLNADQKINLDSIPELKPVLHFRNKASAHLAYTDPRSGDNPATLIESMSIIPCFVNGRIKVGSLTRSLGPHTSSFADHEWSLTENFESLIPRYFHEYITGEN